MTLPASTSDSSGKDRIKLIVAIVIFVAAAGIAWYTLGGEDATDAASVRGFMCNECKEAYDYIPKEGDIEPLKCPNCGAMAGYQAEACFWTKGPDGEYKAKLTPTYVILLQRLDPNTEEETVCPDCGKVVVGHNPMPPEDLMDAARAEAGQ
ncbi:MAG: hypothetical protein DCC65_14735 [Planctomycetota bacterium]|nr:MAG: hypothetical protein DCC65_14735 [Planctomycetota bacterium]